MNFDDFDDDFNGFDDDEDDDFEDGYAYSNGRPYPDFFYEWDEDMTALRQPSRFFEAEELCNIVCFYANESNEAKLKQTIPLALNFHPNDEELQCEIMDALQDCGLWNDLLDISKPLSCHGNIFADSNVLLSLFHLRMEEVAFMTFIKMKEHYADDELLPEVYLAMGDALADIDLYQASIDVCNEAIELFPDSEELYWLNLESYFLLEKNDKALEIADKLSQKNALDAQFWSRLGEVYNRMGEPEHAIEAFQFAESLGFNHNANLLNLVQTYNQSDNYEKALEALEEFRDEQMEATFVPLIAAEMCAKLGQWEKAITYLDKSIAFSPNSELFYHSKAEALIRLKREQEAISVIEEGIRMCNDTDGYLKRILDRFKAGDFDIDREDYLD